MLATERSKGAELKLAASPITVRVLAYSIILASYAGSWIYLTPPPNSSDDVSSVMIGIGPLVLTAYLVASAAVLGADRGYIEIRNFLLCHRVSFSKIREIEVRDGLALRLNDGRIVKSLAHGASLTGEIASYPRSQQAKMSIEGFIADHSLEGRGTAQEYYERSIDWGRWRVGLGLAITLWLSTIAITLFR